MPPAQCPSPADGPRQSPHQGAQLSVGADPDGLLAEVHLKPGKEAGKFMETRYYVLDQPVVGVKESRGQVRYGWSSPTGSRRPCSQAR